MESPDRAQSIASEQYVHCSICANFSNMNSFAHRKSSIHKKKITIKLRKIRLHLSQLQKKNVIVHDADWPDKAVKLFCHFCCTEHPVHHADGDFIIESLGTLYHYSSGQHSQSVKTFLKKNFKEEKSEKYCIKTEDLDLFLAKVPSEKDKYVKKMDFLDKMMVKQIKDADVERKELLESHLSQSVAITSAVVAEAEKSINKVNVPVTQNGDSYKLPPWLENVPPESSRSCIGPQIGPTMDTLVKHMDSLKKKGLPKNRIGANFQHNSHGSTSWLPSFQGVWHKSNRKHLRKQFLRRNFGQFKAMKKNSS